MKYSLSMTDDLHKKQSFEKMTKDFDIALLGTAGLAVPLASYIKRMGKIVLSLGGDLQVLFGVRGSRWRNLQRWHRDYFNEWWLDMPLKYRPPEADLCDSGAFW
jgi:hypothetical protein